MFLKEEGLKEFEFRHLRQIDFVFRLCYIHVDFYNRYYFLSDGLKVPG